MTEKRVPKLRFRDKDEFPEWDRVYLEQALNIYDFKRVPLSELDRSRKKGSYPYYGASGIIDYIDGYIFDGEYILLGEDGANILARSTRLCFLVKGKFWVNNHAHVFQAKDGFSNYFLAEILEKTNYKKYNTGTVQPKLNIESCKKINFFIPQEKEQKKIADFLSAVDEKINLLKQQKTLWQEYKQGAMQQIFSQKIRFKDDDGEEFPEWDFKSLKEIAQKVHSKNKNNNINKVLTNSAELGIVDQGEFFDKDIANKNNLSNYYVVNKDSFVYNPRISKKAPVGPIKRNHLSKGVMSPLYTVFKFSEGCLDFFEYYFESSFWYEYMYSIANFGARHDRMNITTNDFFELPIPYPIKKEQQKIANFLSALDQKVNQIDNQIMAAQTWKQGLMQQMFI